MPPQAQTQSPPAGETSAETLLLLSADDTGRIPFPEGSYREVAAFLEALTRLNEKGYIDHRLHNGFLGCYLTESGLRLRSQMIAARNEDHGNPCEEPAPHRAVYGPIVAAVFGALLLHVSTSQARLGETPQRLEARYGTPVKVENGACARDFECTYKHGGLTTGLL